jgi:hypothetical protein
MGKEPSGNLDIAKEKIANDVEFNELAKKKVIKRLMSKIEIPLRKINEEILDTQLKLVFSEEDNNVIKQMDNLITSYNDSLFNGTKQSITLAQSIELMERLISSIKMENKKV